MPLLGPLVVANSRRQCMYSTLAAAHRHGGSDSIKNYFSSPCITTEPEPLPYGCDPSLTLGGSDAIGRRQLPMYVPLQQLMEVLTRSKINSPARASPLILYLSLLDAIPIQALEAVMMPLVVANCQCTYLGSSSWKF